VTVDCVDGLEWKPSIFVQMNVSCVRLPVIFMLLVRGKSVTHIYHG